MPATSSLDALPETHKRRQRAASGVTIPRKPGNKKTAMLTTYASLATCPTSCPLAPTDPADPASWKAAPCYATEGHVAFITLDLARSPLAPVDQAREEAAAIEALAPRKGPLRLHGSGDCASPEAAAIVGNAAAGYAARSGETVHTYTHAWANVPRDAWADGGAVSVVASCESPAQFDAARAQGYGALAVVLRERPERPVERLADGSTRIVCPEQWTGGRLTCATCPNLCRNERRMRDKRIVVGFISHTRTRAGKARMARTLAGNE